MERYLHEISGLLTAQARANLPQKVLHSFRGGEFCKREILNSAEHNSPALFPKSQLETITDVGMAKRTAGDAEVSEDR